MHDFDNLGEDWRPHPSIPDSWALHRDGEQIGYYSGSNIADPIFEALQTMERIQTDDPRWHGTDSAKDARRWVRLTRPLPTPITVPGHLVYPLPRCAPVVWLRPVRMGMGPQWRRGVWMPQQPKQDEGMVCWDRWPGTEHVEKRVFAGNVGLDLESATGRAHAVKWLQDRAQTARRRGVQSSLYSFGRVVPRGRADRDRFIRFTIGQGMAWGAPGSLGGWPECPGLDGLDPDDPALLPDGSRRVDALALQAVCLHIGDGR